MKTLLSAQMLKAWYVPHESLPLAAEAMLCLQRPVGVGPAVAGPVHGGGREDEALGGLLHVVLHLLLLPLALVQLHVLFQPG